MIAAVEDSGIRRGALEEVARSTCGIERQTNVLLRSPVS
jgi:hypothetical protein